MARVEVRRIVKKFGEKVTALAGVDLLVKDQEFLVILGPSGCGKTTLLRIVAGLETPTEGDVFIGDQRVNELPPRARGIAMVFQSYALYPHMRVYDNIAYPLKTQRMPKPQIRQKVEQVAQMLRIHPLLDRRPRELSGGERQRVALARALVRQPSVFLMDEPLSNLDAKLRASARHELKRFQRDTGVTTIYVTHDQVEAMGMGDRIAVMDTGRVRQVGTPDEIYHNPADTFVATFIGSPPMNLIPGDQVLWGFRPENFLPLELLGGEEVVRFPFQVTRVEPLGAERIIYGYVDGRHLATSRMASGASFTVCEGETYTFGVRKGTLLTFDKETGQRTDRCA